MTPTVATIQTLLVGPYGHGGEGVYMSSLESLPPPGVRYERTGGFHRGARGAPCQVLTEVALNRIVHPRAIPDMGFRAIRMRGPFDLAHVHAHPIRLTGKRGTPLVMSEGSSSAVYIGEYLGWDDEQLRQGFRRARRLYRALGIRDRLLALERVTAAYVFSQWARSINVSWGADPAKIEVIYPGFATPPMVDRTARTRFTFLFVGGDFERKGGFEVVEAFARVSEEHPHARLVLAGSDPSVRNPDRHVHSWVAPRRRERAIALLAQLERRGVARLVKWVDRARLVRELFPEADAFVMPTHAEGFGFTNVEAMSFGLPVVTSTVGPAEEILAGGHAGLLVPPGDCEAIGGAMRMLLADRQRALRMGEAGRAEFVARFTNERRRGALGDFYRRALEA